MNPDKTLLDRISAGDEEALAELHRAYYPRLARFLLRLIGDEQLVAEVINDVFFAIWRNAGNFAGRSSPSTWILGIAYRQGLKAVRRKRPEQPLEDDVAGASTVEGLSQRQDIDRLLARLSPTQRAVVELTYFFGYTYGEIAAVLDCPEGTVKTRMYHARRLLSGWVREDSP